MTSIHSPKMGLVIPKIPSITNQNHMADATPEINGKSFADHLKNNITSFVNRAHATESIAFDYIDGKEDIEFLAPQLKNLMLEFEEKTKIISSVVSSLKNVLNTPL